MLFESYKFDKMGILHFKKRFDWIKENYLFDRLSLIQEDNLFEYFLQYQRLPLNTFHVWNILFTFFWYFLNTENQNTFC